MYSAVGPAVIVASRFGARVPAAAASSAIARDCVMEIRAED